MKKKGFTLIELIVVIAIIGVLAAILVPAMLGYVKKSKITTANTTAKSVYNAFNSALTDMDTEDYKIALITSSTADEDGSTADWKATTKPSVATSSTVPGDLKKVMAFKVHTYFSDIEKVKTFRYELTNGGCTAVGVLNGAYPGSYPKPMSVDDFGTKSSWTATDALNYAKS